MGEARDKDAKRVSFFAIDGSTGVPLWQNLGFEEPWWIGIEDVTDEVLLLHKFASPDMPQHRGIIALELKTGKRLWSNDEATFWFSHKTSVYVHRLLFEKRVASELDAKSGAVTKEFSEDGEPSLYRIREEAIRSNQDGLQFPEVVDPTLNVSEYAAVLKRELPAKGLLGAVELAVAGHFTVFNYHTVALEAGEEGTLVDSRLKIIDDRTGNAVYSDTLSRNSVGPVPDSFFIRNRTLFYIKDQKTLVAVQLTD